MSVLEILEEFKKLNVVPRLDGGQLKLHGDTQKLEADFIRTVTGRKAELIAFLEERRDELEGTVIPALERRESYAASNAQKRLWLLSRLDGGSAAYNIVTSLYVKGGLVKERLEASFRRSIERHESLRTNFRLVDGELHQAVLDQFSFSIRYKDLSSAGNVKAALEAELQACTQEVLDLENGLPLRVTVYQLGENEQALVLNLHHIISDGWSVSVLLREVMDRYEAIGRNEEAELPPLRIQYKDYADWAEGRTGAKADGDRVFWQRQFGSKPEPLSLPYDFVRPAQQSFEGAVSKIYFDEALCAGMAAYGRSRGVTLFNLLRSVLTVLLHKFSGEGDITIGTPVAGRNHRELEGQVGFYVNTLPLRFSVDGELAFDAFADRVAAHSKEVFEHQECGFEKIVEEAGGQRDGGRNPLFDVVMALQDVSAGEGWKRGGLELSRLDSWLYGAGATERKGVFAKFDLDFNFGAEGERYYLELEYATRLFTQERAHQLMAAFTYIMKQVLAEPSIRLGAISVVDADEEKKILAQQEDTTDYPREATLVSLFEDQAGRTPGGIAVVCEGASLTYQQLNEQANQLAHYLRQNYAVQNDALIGIKLERSLEMIVAIIAILKAGGAYVPIDPSYPRERIDYMIGDSNCLALIDEEELNTFYKEQDQYNTSNPERVNKASDLAYVIYTSGTTGKPKGSLIEHRNVVRLLVNDAPLFDFNERDVWTMFHSYCFDFSVWEMYGALLFGGKLVMIPSLTAKDPAAFRELLKSEGVTVLNQTPSAFYNLIKEELGHPDSSLQLRYVIFGGEALSPGKLAGWHQKYPKTALINMYGITETTVHVTYKQIGEEEIKANSASIGRPIPTLSCYVLDAYGQLAPIGVAGELYVGGEGVCRGYLNRPELTAKKFIDSPFQQGESLYRSGDKARLLPNGELEYGGRIDDQVKIRGYRIELGEVESALRRNGKIEDVVLLARRDEAGEMSLVAYLTAKEELNVTELRLELAAQLPAYMLPAHYVQLDHFPLTSNGKVDKKALPEPESASLSSGVEYVAPRTSTEEKLVTIWQELLGKDRISIKDNFFDLGGHSLRVISLMGRIHKAFDIKVDVKDLFAHAVLEEQAAFIGSAATAGFTGIEPIAEQDDYALSPAQRRLWILGQLEQGNEAYNIPAAYVFEGDFQQEALSAAFAQLLERHESLRTVFRTNTRGEARQVIRTTESLGFSLDTQDLQGVDEEALKARVQSEFMRPFDMARGPLLRAGVYRIGEAQWLFTCVLHHIITDGLSMSILIRELLGFYNSFAHGEAHTLSPLRIHYKDYAAWLDTRQQQAVYEEHKAYWLGQLAGELPVLPLMGDKPRPAVKTYNGATVSEVLQAPLCAGLRQLCADAGGTLFMGLQALVNTLLYRYTAQEDMITGTQIAGRDHADLDDQIGLYLNTLALRMRVEGNKSFRTLLQSVRGATLAAYEHQAYPFDELVDALDLQRDASRNPLFDVSVVLQNAALETLLEEQSTGFAIRRYEALRNAISKFDIAFDFVETGDEIQARLVYNTDIYTADSAARMLRHFSQLAAAVIAVPDAAVAQVNYLSVEEQDQLLNEFNDTKVAYPSESIAALFEAQAMATPNKTALVFGDKQLTYKELNEQANKLAAYLRNEYHVRPDDKVAIMLDRSEALPVAILGVLKSGAAYVPVDVDYPAARKQFILNDTQAQVLITQSDYLFELDYFSGSLFAIDVQLEGLEEAKNVENINKSTDLAYVMYTSGSTGNPKGVLIEQRSVVRLVKSSNWLSFSGEEVILSTGAVSFDATTFEYWAALLNGGTLVLCTKETLLDEQKLAEQILSNHVDTMWFTSGWLNQLVDKDISVFHGLKTIVAGGDKLSAQHIRLLRSAYPDVQIINGYGPTENTTFSLTYTVGNATEPILIGKPITNSTAYILDAQGGFCPIGVVGEICVGGDGLARGYLNNDELTEQKFIHHSILGRLYKTGDLGRWLADGNIEFLGRKDSQVKVRGYRIEPGEIENALQAHADVEAAVVAIRGEEAGEKQIVAYVVSPETLAASDLRAFLSQQLPSYMLPDRFVQLEALPLNANGKVDRKALPDETGMDSGAEYIAPRTETEIKLAAIWSEILNRSTISVTDNFFEIGGHSLKATRLASQIHREFNVKMELRDIFTKTVLEEQAQLIDSARKDLFVSIQPVEQADDYAVSSSQRRLWAHSRIEDVNLTYNIPVAYVFEGDLNLPAFAQAFDSLIERHEILRTFFREDSNGQIRQSIQPASGHGFHIETEDLRATPDNETELLARVQHELTQPFDLTAGPLLRARLYWVADNRWVLAYVMHHIISDGWSMGVLTKELFHFYHAHTNGQAHTLSPLRIQYKDYAAWQQQQLHSVVMQEQKEYWLGQFSGRLPVLQLPADHERPAVQTQNGNVVVKQLDAALVAGLKGMAQQEGGTLFMSLLAAVNALLYRYTGQQDLIIGTPIAAREHADLHGQIGYYLNTLALRTRFHSGKSFTDLLSQVRDITLAAYEHQSYPFDELVEALKLKRDLGRSLLFDVMILLQNFDGSAGDFEQDFGGLSVRRYRGAEHVVSKYDLTFYFTETGDTIRTDIEYNTDIFERGTIVRMGDYLARLLEAIIQQPAAPLDKLVRVALGSGPLPVALPEMAAGRQTSTEHQKRLWFIDQFERNYLYEGSPVYHNLPLVIRMEDCVDTERLLHSVRQVVARHSVLRTNLTIENSEPLQVVAAHREPIVGVHLAKDFRDACLSLIERPFAIETDPLIRFDLVMGEDDVFIITAHHLVADRSSLKLLFQEIMDVYAGSVVKNVSAYYLSFSAWQNGLQAQELESSSFYWTRKLSRAPVLYLDTDQPREHIHIYRAATHAAVLPSNIAGRVADLCRAQGLGPFEFFLAAFHALLHRYTAAGEIVIGSFNDYRSEEAVRQLAGPLANLVSLKADVDGGLLFQDLLAQVREDWKESIAFGSMPFEKVVLDLNPGKDMSRTALFDVLIHYDEKIGGGFEEIEWNRGLGKYDLNLLVKKEEGFSFYLTYNELYFDAARIERFVGYYINLIDQALQAPELAIGGFKLLGEEEKDQLVYGFNNVATDYPCEATLVSLFEEQAARTPEGIAVVCEGAWLTYQQLNEQANQLAHYLRQNYTVQSDALIGIKLERSLEMIVAIIAILKAGGAYVPIDPSYPQERIDYMIGDSNCLALIDEEELNTFYSTQDQYSTVNPERINKPSDLAYVIYTSGTTGKPKGSLIEHRNVVRLLVNDAPLFDFNERDVWTMFHSYCFDFSVWEMYGALLFGGKLVMIPSLTAKDPSAFREVLKQEGVTVLNQTPSAFYNLIKEELGHEENALQLRYVIFGGEALSPGKLSGWHQKYPQTQLINMYGITETTVHVTYKQIGEEEIKANSASIGRPIPTLSCYVLDAYGQLAPIGVAGELYVGGEGVCRGYLNRPELTQKKFIDSPFRQGERLYRSGDKARLLPNGELEYGGRIDDQVKIRGYRIELGEVESALRRSEKIEDVVLLARRDEAGEMSLVAYLTAKEELNVTELRLELAAQLPAYMLPAHYVQLDHFPLTSNGKVDKKALPEPESASLGSGVEYVAPRTSTEEKLVAIWQELLGKDRIGTKDNFFEIGGHSLKATRLASQVYKEFEVRVALKDLFTHVRLEDLAGFIDNAQTTAYTAIQPVAPAADYEASAAQRRLWVLSQFEETSAAYNMPAAYLFEGSLDDAALGLAFAHLIERHESLRTTFRTNEQGEVRQQVHAPGASGFAVSHRDLRHEPRHLLNELVQEEGLKPFDLAGGPLLRVTLCRLADDQWLFIYVMHHIVSDGWSMGVLIRELLTLYHSFTHGEAHTLSPLRIHYKDYAAWQNGLHQQPAYEAHKQYWLNQLAGELPVLELPGDHPRPVVKTYNGGAVSRTIGTQLSATLRELGREESSTLFMILLAGVNTLLHRYTGQEDLIIGSPIAGRQHADLEGQIGFYLNTLALRTRFEGGSDFRTLLRSVKKMTLEAYEHQLYPFDELVNALDLPRNLSRSPLFDVMVILQNTDNEAVEGNHGALTVKAWPSEQLITKFDLLFNFVETGDEIRLDLEYNSDLYDRSTAARLCLHLEQLLAALAANPGASINTIDYLDAAERRQLLETFNDTAASFPENTTLTALFEEQAELRGDATALVFDGRTFSYRELNERANQLAHYLRKTYRVRADDIIAIKLERSEWMIISLLAVLKSGAAYLPIDPEYPQERIDYIVEDSGCKAVIDAHELEHFRKEEVLHLKKNPLPLAGPHSLAYVIYTSGSTGRPKGCLLEHRGVINRLEWMWVHYGFDQSDVILQKTTFTFDVSVWELFLPLCWGAKMVLCQRDDVHAPDRIAAFIEEQGVTCLHFVPGMLNAFIATLFGEETVALRLQSLRRVITSGEALAPGTVNTWYDKLDTPIHNLYGPTEASVDVTYYATKPNEAIVPIGRPIWNTQMYVLGKADELLPVGAVGEICIGGDGLARGYLNKEILTAEKFVANPFVPSARIYRTGDVGRWLADGNIEYLGRKDDQVKIRGFRIELGEIGNALLQHASIDAAAVITITDRRGEKELAAYVVSRELLTATDLRAWLVSRLPAYMVPAHFVQLDELPLTPNGKTDRKRLPAPEGVGLGSGTEYRAPANETEEKLAAIWQEVLGRGRIGTHDNFFDLGGHSLKALLLAGLIQKEFAINLTVKEVFLNPTIEALGNLVRVGQWVDTAHAGSKENRNIIEV